jgi:flagellar hook assembly protein FlgD
MIDNLFRVILGVGIVLLASPVAVRSLSLNPDTDVIPRIFSPNNDGINDVVFFKVNNPQQTPMAGVVLDMSGAQVATLVLAPNGIPTADSLMWSGRDENGSLVPPGPYIYRIDGDGSILTGVVVVAR